MDISLDDLPFIINACFVLINFCEANRDIIADQLSSMTETSSHQHHFQTMKLNDSLTLFEDF